MAKPTPKVTNNPIQAGRLCYAERGWWTFAAPFITVWVEGVELKKGIKWACPETNNVRWGATLVPEVIRAEFNGKLFFGKSLRKQNVGVATGAESGIFDIETDTAGADHGDDVDGEAALKAWEAVHGELPPTLMAISPSGSIHRIFNHPGHGIKIKSFPAIFGEGCGVDCKGDGGMFLAPPSYRPPIPAKDGKPAKAGGFYTWINEGHPIADAPPALLDVVIDKAAENPAETAPIGSNPFLDFDQGSDASRIWAEAALENEVAILASAPKGKRNNQLNKSAFNLGQIVGGGALTEKEVIEALTAAAKANGSIKDDGGNAFRKSIASGLKDGKPKPRRYIPRIIDTMVYIEPTAPAANFDDLDAARQHFRAGIRNLLNPIPNPFSDYGDETGAPTNPRHCAWAHRIDTGVGKTSITIEEIAKSDKTFVYAVPTLDLADRVAQQFAALGVVAPVWRGRTADDPETPGEEMCLNPDPVALAVKVQADVTTSCCKYKNFKCDFLERCGYQKQIALLKQDKPRVIIAAADMLFHETTAIGTPDFVVLDEAFWPKQLRGIDGEDRFFMSFDRMRKRGHGKLADSLSQQQEIGGLQRKYSFGYYDLTNLIIEQYKLKPDIGLRPGMSRQEVEELKKEKDKIGAAIYSKRIIAILKELRRMHRDWDMEQPSGRLLIEEKEGTRGIRWRGVAKITKQFRRETLILDATLPDLAVLQITHPLSYIDSDIRVALPETVNIRQVLGSPTSSNKLIKSKAKMPERHLQSIRRYILRRWMQIGKGPTTVICQQEVALWLCERLPDEIRLLHFNALVGLDDHKDARLLIVVGRTQPGPKGVEALAATLSGVMPTQMVTPVNGFAWFDRVQRGIRLRDGTGVAVQGDLHPDPFHESIRWQTCEAELVQAIGRARAIWRTEKTPLDIDLLFNTVLPITITKLLPWSDQSLLIETAATEGVMLASTVDLMKLWPAIWPNHSSAERTLAAGIPKLPGFEPVTYQLDGPKMKQRVGYFDRRLISDPLAWLTERLGPLTVI